MIRRSLILVVLILTALFSRGGPALANMLQDRVKTVVAVEFFTETELDRRSTNTFGVVIDDNGTIVFSSQAVGARVSPKQLEDFRIYFPGEPTTQQYSATYLGRDEFTGWEYIRVDEEAAR